MLDSYRTTLVSLLELNCIHVHVHVYMCMQYEISTQYLL